VLLLLLLLLLPPLVPALLAPELLGLVLMLELLLLLVLLLLTTVPASMGHCIHRPASPSRVLLPPACLAFLYGCSCCRAQGREPTASWISSISRHLGPNLVPASAKHLSLRSGRFHTTWYLGQSAAAVLLLLLLLVVVVVVVVVAAARLLLARAATPPHQTSWKHPVTHAAGHAGARQCQL
jgi:hypothetical protein